MTPLRESDASVALGYALILVIFALGFALGSIVAWALS
jgi:hypothetical protein